MNTSQKSKSSKVVPLTNRKATLMVQRKKRQYSCAQGFSEKLKFFDIYGEQVRLTYKGQDTFRTPFGSVVSLVLIFVLLAYGAFRFNLLVQLSDSTFNSFDYLINLNEAGQFRPQDMGFDVAFSFSKELDPSYGYFTAKIVKFHYSNETYDDGSFIKIKERIDLEIGKCGTEYFNYSNKEEVQLYGIENFFCIKNKSYALEGDYYSDVFEFLEVKLWKCQNTSTFEGCQDPDKIDEFFSDQSVSWAYVNTNFDFNDYKDSIKYFIDDSLFWIIEPDRIKYTNFYIMQADAELEDAYLQFGQQKELEFYRVKNSRSYSGVYTDYSGFVCAVFVRFDKFKSTSKRQIYSILTLLGDIGGLQSSIYIIGFLVVTFFQHRMFISQIVKNIYQVRKEDAMLDQKTEAEIGEEFDKNLKGKHDSEEQSQASRRPSLNAKTGHPMFEEEGYRKELDAQLREKYATMKIANEPNTFHFKRNKSNQLQPQTSGKEPTEWEGPSESSRNLVKKQIVSSVLKNLPSRPTSTNRQSENNFSQVVKQIDTLSLTTIQQILMSMINRQRFSYTIRSIFRYLFGCMCCRKVNLNRDQSIYKEHFLFSKARHKLLQELDVINMVRSVRKLKLVTHTLLNQKHRMLLRFQRQNLVETESSSGDSDENRYDTLRLMENKHPMIKLVIFGKLKRMMLSYYKQKIGPIDQKLLRGVFTRKIKDFDEDFREFMENRSLMTRLHTKLFQQKESLTQPYGITSDRSKAGFTGRPSSLSISEESQESDQRSSQHSEHNDARIPQQTSDFLTPSIKLPIRNQPGKQPTIIMKRLSTRDEDDKQIKPAVKDTSETVSLDQSHHFSDDSQKQDKSLRMKEQGNDIISRNEVHDLDEEIRWAEQYLQSEENRFNSHQQLQY